MKNKELWWRTGSIYQVYVRSFKDSNNDGNGDINGLISKLDYLHWLGIKAIWINPIAKSPMVDNGYDVSDYKDIDPLFGTMSDFENLIEKAHSKNIKIIWDFPLNHTSSEHPWFKQALKGNPKYLKYYYFTKTYKLNRDSVFGGSFWTKTSNGYYYAHVFAKEQPCLNWFNQDVVDEFVEIINFWLDKGVDGFRFDAFDEIGKPTDLFTRENFYEHDKKFVIEKFKELRQKTWKDDNEIMSVSESWAMNSKDVNENTNLENKAYSLTFNFDHMISEFEYVDGKKTWKGFDFIKFKKIIAQWQKDVSNGWNSLYFNNHDQPRAISRFLHDQVDFLDQKAKAFALTLHGLKGTPFIYQGEEIGMDNSDHTNDISKINDVNDLRTYEYHVLKQKIMTHNDFMKLSSIFSRDNARTPIPWNSKGGFNDSGKSWLPYNKSFKTINVEDQIDQENSVLSWYKKVIDLRNNPKIRSTIIQGDFELIADEDPNIFAYKRKDDFQELVFVINWSQKLIDNNLNLKNYEVFLNNYPTYQSSKLLPWQALILIRKS
ncbi:OLIGO-1,6-GLUCOSIDASE (SUCRASE-ISOMALTASE) (LIMIT DEXTRINASE) (ISOMALTASE) (DEXTRIN 6-ALPHA-D-GLUCANOHYDROLASE) [Mycoplasmopsis pulmonis]|uniref:OLIGO-1,6-GLUCOSIDASE (SUCRASE-ISOMALTASE) (LIMIT DEXTRINASE) (ISOMALTASE) (DEXTRIN 6-ALPHA-D-GLUCANOHYDROLASE) n=1 Tax=Mycoplasmopsis pulmonis (strain UAB CTIP) TaxID=272635 RepID=Q98RA7_MYCPU|nr:alpha-glucosidase [Mycoplasmopsis pulmonis]MDZ7293074.1 alpha-glucosidase [Mycoplasmopsis pulmonis]CAC13276.1 OLIGO-1,6-GLUCOSIDASE (SUCRASE-ISOMALTASE) (LIMIT DEXTRINASE) (ISOMALTASE) (DEXTRIN 6-ALPHA-D-GLUCANOHYDROLASE) [Mycoplasmopsis pulmonis]VEU67867.1 Oligo-1,6-glucosidase 1 [Mycoplasmopsis pulmonis]